MKTAFTLLTAAWLATVGLASPPETPRLKAGDPIPQGAVVGADGVAVSLAELAGGRPTVLIFYRGGWCPYCSRHLEELAAIVDTLTAEGFQIIAVSPDRPAKLREKPDLGDLPYSLYSDSSMAVSKAFGIAFRVDDKLVDKYKNSYGIDLEGDSGETHHLLPHPSVFIVDGKGIIRFAHVDPDYKVRIDPDEIVETARSIP